MFGRLGYCPGPGLATMGKVPPAPAVMAAFRRGCVCGGGRGGGGGLQTLTIWSTVITMAHRRTNAISNNSNQVQIPSPLWAEMPRQGAWLLGQYPPLHAITSRLARGSNQRPETLLVQYQGITFFIGVCFGSMTKKNDHFDYIQQYRGIKYNAKL